MADTAGALLPLSVDEVHVKDAVAETSTGAGEPSGAVAGAGEALESGLMAAAIGPCVPGLLPGPLASTMPLSAIAAIAAAATTAIRKGP